MSYPYNIELPTLVIRSHEQAERLGFPMMPQGRPIGKSAPTTTITPADGALLRALVAGYPAGRICEIGTGAGVSTAWLISGMLPNSFLLSCKINPELASAAISFFKEFQFVEIRAGDWSQVLSAEAPFDLLFFDANAREVLMDADNWPQVASLVRIGGKIIMDDLTPVELWPPEWKDNIDYKRDFCLCNPQIAGVEVRTTKNTVSLICTRIY
ncbi:class I SAM-dependent methyltransferase [Nostoc punctiforme UO1]|uniref:O-methyltransferase n=1 Tax=Nostoc punctiforme TaxID=272131 RepID=UPI00309C21BD